MKRTTLLTFLCVVLTVSFGMAQTTLSSSMQATGSSIENGPPGTASQMFIPIGTATTITPNASQAITPGLEIACASPSSFRDNNIFVDFDLAADYAINGDFRVGSIEVAIGPVTTPGWISTYWKHLVFGRGIPWWSVDVDWIFYDHHHQC